MRREGERCFITVSLMRQSKHHGSIAHLNAVEDDEGVPEHLAAGPAHAVLHDEDGDEGKDPGQGHQEGEAEVDEEAELELAGQDGGKVLRDLKLDPEDVASGQPCSALLPEI